MNQGVRDCRRGGAEGFTLVELMLVVAIIAIMAGLAIFLLGRGGEERDVRSMTSEISQRLLAARMTAISQNQSVLVELVGMQDSRATSLTMRRFRSPVLGEEEMEGCPDTAPSDIIFQETWVPGSGGRFPRAAVTSVWPNDADQTDGGAGDLALAFCFMPSGRVLNRFGEPHQSGLDILYGTAYVEIAGVTRDGGSGTWRTSPIRRVALQVPLNGVVAQMPPSFIADRITAAESSPDDDD